MNSRSATLALGFSSIGHFFAHLMMLLYPTVILALEGGWGMSYGDLLALSLGGFLLFGLGALPAGWLGDRWSAEGMMVIFFLGTGGAAIATGLTSGPTGLAVGLAMVGLFGSIYHPVGTAWLVRNAENRGRALGWNGIFGSVGLASAPFVAGALAQLISWRAAFIVPGMLCAAAGITMWCLMRGGTMVAARTDRRPQPEAPRADVVRAFVVLSVTMLAVGLVSQAMSVGLPKAFAERLTGLTNGGILGAGGFVTAVYLVSATAQLVGGWLADRFALKAVYLVAWAVQAPLFVVAAQASDGPLLAAVMAVSYLGVMATPAENALLARYTPERWRATAYGAKFVLSLGVSTFGVALVALVHDRTGSFASLWLALAGCSIVVVVAGLFLPGRLRSRPAPSLAPQPAE